MSVERGREPGRLQGVAASILSLQIVYATQAGWRDVLGWSVIVLGIGGLVFLIAGAKATIRGLQCSKSKLLLWWMLPLWIVWVPFVLFLTSFR